MNLRFYKKAWALFFKSKRRRDAARRLVERFVANDLTESAAAGEAPAYIDTIFRLVAEKSPALRAAVIERVVKEHQPLVEVELAKFDPGYALCQECYAQEGEDLVLARLFSGKRDGFYVDIGAHHPIRFSNTYLLYRLGWCGINIDATPQSMDEFRRLRPRDINIECLVASRETSRTFYLLTEPALNTSSAELARQRARENPRYQISGITDLKARRLSSLLDEHMPPGREIDLLSVDVEGLDLDVLQSNDWKRYRPTIILAELLPHEQDEQNETAEYLRGQGYRMVSRFFNTVLFQRH